MDKDLSLLERIALIKNEIEYIQKNKPKGVFWALNSYDKVLEKLKPLELKYGIVCYQRDVQILPPKDLVDKKSGQVKGSIAQLISTFEVSAIGVIDKILTTIACSFADSDGLEVSKAQTHAFLKFMILFYGIETGENERKEDDEPTTPPLSSEDLKFISSEKVKQLEMLCALTNVTKNTVCRAANASELAQIYEVNFKEVYDRLIKKGKELKLDLSDV